MGLEDTNMKLTHIKIHNFRGIETLDVAVPPAGLIASGGNARGKTTFLKAVRSALEAIDVAPDAIRIGADRADVFVNLDHVSVKRVITKKGSKVSVERDGLEASKPTTYLRELLGTTGLDPLELYLAKPKDRRALILSALPCTITVEQLRKYAPEIEDSFDVSGHGLEVLERARKFFYDERTVANKDAAEAKREAERLAEAARVAAQAVTPGPALPEAEARAALTSAERELLTLENRATEAAESERRTSAQRASVESLREQAAELEAGAGEEVETAEAEDLIERAAEAVRILEEQLAAKRHALETLRSNLAQARAKNEARGRALSKAADLRAQADTLVVALKAATVAAPAEAELSAAKQKVETSRATLDRAVQQAKALEAVAAATKATETAKACAAEAEELDAIVKRLTNDAPNDLLAAANAIPGLSLTDDAVLLDGKSLDALSGAEQLKFAVDIARRANTKTKILIVDGLERLDADQLDAFVKYATRDDWQLIGSLVTKGELVVAAIEPTADTAAAAE